MVDTFDHQTDSFLKWFSELPGSHMNSKVSPMDFRHRGAGRGLVAKQEIFEDEELFTLSRSNVLSVRNSELSRHIPEVLGDFDPWLSLILVLMYEYLKGDDSFWKPYLNMLPQNFNTLMYWSKEEVNYLQASAIVHKIGKEEADTMFAEIIVPTIRKYEHIFYSKNSTPLSEVELSSLAHRMGSTIMAYAFDTQVDEDELEIDDDGFAIDDDEAITPKAMIPMADMLNADALHNAYLQYDEGFFTMRALANIQAGDEIFNDYGPLPRSDLLRRYGYINDSYSRYDVVELSQDLVVNAVKNHRSHSEDEMAARFRLLEKLGLLEDAFVLSQGEAEKVVPKQLKMFVKILLAATQDYDKIRKVWTESNRILSLESAQVIQEAISERLSQYSTTVDDDEALLNDAKITGRLRLAIEIRVSEKRILELAVGYLVSQVEPSG